MDSDKYLEGQSMQRPPLFKSDKTKVDEVVPSEKQTDDLKRRLAKNNEAKMVIYNVLPRKEYERIFMCNTAKEIWKTLLITHQGNSQVKDNKIDLLVQQYEQFVISEDESIDNAFARFNTIITSLKALDEGYSSKNYLIGNLKVHEMIIKKDSEIVKAKVERKSLALKAKKESSDEECSTSGSEDEEYAMAPPKDKNQKAFVGGSWSDSVKEDDEKVKDKICPVAYASSEWISNVKWVMISQIEMKKTKDESTRLNKFEKSTHRLDEMLSHQKPSGDKLGLGFNSFEASSSGTKEIKFIKAQKKASSDGGPINRDGPINMGGPLNVLAAPKINKGPPPEMPISEKSVFFQKSILGPRPKHIIVNKVKVPVASDYEVKQFYKPLSKPGVRFSKQNFRSKTPPPRRVNNNYSRPKTPQPRRHVGQQNQPHGFPVTWNNFPQQSYMPWEMFGKQAHASHKAKNLVSTTRCLELLHMDLFGPSAVRSYGGNRYTLVIVDDYSRYTWTRFLKDKTEAFDQFEIFSKKIQNQLGCTIVSIRTDHGREFDNEVQFGEFCNANGITHNFSAPRTPQSNGVVERKNRTLQEIRKTPYEILRGRKPTLDYFRVFGSKCFILNTKDYLTKFDPKSYEGVFLGYSQNSKAYIILNKHTRKIEESLNVTFDETPPPSKTSPLVDDDLDEEEAIREIEKKNLENDVEDETLEIDEIVNIKESRNHPLENAIGNLNQRTLRSQAQNQSNFYCFVSTIKPKNVNEALGDKSWIVAMQEELNQFIANDVWELVPQPKNMTIIGTKWVFRNKLDENGIVSRNKARLVAQGYNQQEGIDYDETYAPVARLESIRILLAYACALDFKLFQMDVKSAFLNGFINEEVYVAQPPGFIDFEKPDHVYKLKKALYGLKQAPKAWYDRLKAFLIKHEYKMGMVDNTLFTKKKSSNLIIVQIYVDDIIFGSTCQDMCDEFAKIMHDEFEMSMMGELNFFLGLQIKQMEDGIFFNQSKYIKEMLKKFGLEDSKPMKTPMSSDTKLMKDEECESVDSTKYRGMIGSLLYLTASRPDIMFSVCLCARFQEAPKTSHLEAVKRIFRYIKGTTHLGLWYPKGTGIETVVYADSDHAGDYVDRKSTSGICTFVGYCLTSWFSKKQTALAISTTEAEYVSAKNACQQALWLKQALIDYDV
ncbi:retrovirus-related pol polyprotein from transposon TNT 1-94 [Tanacetum coccineum]